MDFFDNHSHWTVFREELSSLLNINASIMQGSAIGKLDVQVRRQHVYHHLGQQRDDAACGAHQSADMGSMKQPQAELQQVDRGHLQRPQAKATPRCGRC